LDFLESVINLPPVQLDFITAKEFLDRRQDVLKRLGRLGFQSDLAVGIEILDQILGLRFGRFIVLQGKPSHKLSALLCVRATLHPPLGPNSDVIFVDGGNVFDPYLISQYAIEHELDSEAVLERLHISRAFTYHQLTSLLTEKLLLALDSYNAKLVVVSDMPLLFCDPDIRGADRQDAHQIFMKTMKFLGTLAERRHALILATNLQSRNPRMDNLLLYGAHVSVKLEEKNTFTEVSVAKHHWIPQVTFSIPKLGAQNLERYL
jgi:hypothetical protein